MDNPIDFGPDVFGDPFQEAGDPFKMGWEYPNSPNLNEQSIFDIYEKQFEDYGMLDIHEMLFNPPPEPPSYAPPEILDPLEFVRPEQLGHSMNEPPMPEEGGINENIHAPEDPTRTVPYGRSRPFFGRMPLTFFDRIVEKVRKAASVKSEDEIEDVEWEDIPADDVRDENQ